MITLKNAAQITAMRDAGRITGEALLIARDMVRPGISTYEIDQAIRKYIEKCGAVPAFLGYGNPGSVCSFGGRKVYYETHGTDQIYELRTARQDSIVPYDYFEWWGIEDKYLF